VTEAVPDPTRDLHRGEVDGVELDSREGNRYVDYVEARLGAARSGSPAIAAW
jgi:hypothetical protein